jgi:hypothetical protein
VQLTGDGEEALPLVVLFRCCLCDRLGGRAEQQQLAGLGGLGGCLLACVLGCLGAWFLSLLVRQAGRAGGAAACWLGWVLRCFGASVLGCLGAPRPAGSVRVLLLRTAAERGRVCRGGVPGAGDAALR